MKLVTSSQNSLIKHLLRLQKDASYRKESKTLILEGKKPVLEAAQKGWVKSCILRENLDLEGSFEKTWITAGIAQKLSSLKSPEGYFAEVQRPENESLDLLDKVLVLDGVQNPGNMGTLIRTAKAFGFEGIFITEGSVDPYSPKVLRASMGASLDIPIYIGSKNELLELSERANMSIFVADASGDSIEKTPIKKPYMLVLGNESQGSWLKTNYKTVSLPIKGVDSLNVAVAGSLLMYLIGRSNEN